MTFFQGHILRRLLPLPTTLGPASLASLSILSQRVHSCTSVLTTLSSSTMAQQNPSFVLQEVGVVRFEDRPVPVLSDPHDVLVEVRFTGICGSDVHYYTHGRIGQFVVKKPLVLGHESAGVVRAVGSTVSTLQVGDEVAMEPGTPCRRCAPCKTGHYNLCPDMSFAATPPIDGTLTKFYTLPEDLCYKLPANVSMQEGALLEPAAVAVHFCRLAKVSPGQSVVVFGAGPVGMLACKVARGVFGATTVVAIDVNEERLDFAKEHAATHVFHPAKDATPETTAREILKHSGLPAEGADVVIDASGAQSCIQTAVHVARPGGAYTQGGMGTPDVLFPIGMLCSKELHVTGNFRYSGGDYRLALGALAAGKFSVRELISKVVSFEDAQEAFENVRHGHGVKWLIAGPK